MLLAFLLARFDTTVTDCALAGICGMRAPTVSALSGVMFVAVGLVALGVRGMSRATR